MAMVQHAPVSAPSPTPFTDFVLARIPDEETQKLFALSFGDYLKRDPDAQDIDFDDVYRWLGIPLKAKLRTTPWDDTHTRQGLTLTV
jgi:hypothetical protein